tara:strand:+ start:4353 stop:5255 length:903 start_codon:yes stop_codon:yes gene_type:complete
MKCAICGNKNFKKFSYDSHTRKFNLKKLIKFFLIKIDFIIPNKLIKLKSISSRNRNGFSGFVNVCIDCGYGVMDAIPSKNKLIQYYNLDYWKMRDTAVPKFKKLYKKNLRGLSQSLFSLDFIKKIKPKNLNFLDIGAAGAWAMLNIRDKVSEKKINLHTVEAGKIWESYYQEAKIKKVSDFFPFKSKIKYDYIHTSHWLEHVRDIKSTLNWFTNNINKGGFVFVEVPNTEFNYWDEDIDDTPHIHFFTRKSLEKLFKKYNFECVKIDVLGPSYLELISKQPIHHKKNSRGVYLRAIFKRK